MRILQLAESISTTGGIEHFVTRLSVAMTAQAHTTLVVVGDRLPAEPMPFSVARADIRSPSAREEVLKIAREFEPDVVLLHQINHEPLVDELRCDYPVAELVHSFVCHGGKLFRRRDAACGHAVGWRCLIDWYTGPCGWGPSPAAAVQSYRHATGFVRALQRVDAVLVGTYFMRDYLVQEGVAQDHIRVIDLAEGLPPEQGARRPEAETQEVLFVGRLVYNKGVQYLLRALVLLPETFRLTVVGDGFYRQTLEALTTELGLQDRVHFAGQRTGQELEDCFQAATVLAFPSLLPEPAGLVVPEARGHGLPVVAFDVGGVGEWASTYGYGGIHLAEPADAAALARALAQATTGEPPALASAPQRELQPVLSILQELVAQRKPATLRGVPGSA